MRARKTGNEWSLVAAQARRIRELTGGQSAEVDERHVGEVGDDTEIGDDQRSLRVLTKELSDLVLGERQEGGKAGW